MITISLGSGRKSWERWIQYYAEDDCKLRELDIHLMNMYRSVSWRQMKAKSSPGVWCKQNKEQKHMLPSLHTVLQIQLILQGKIKSINISLWRLPTSLVRLNRARCRWAGVRTQPFFFLQDSNELRGSLFEPDVTSNKLQFSPPPPPPQLQSPLILHSGSQRCWSLTRLSQDPRQCCQFTERQTAVYNHNHTHCFEFPI